MRDPSVVRSKYWSDDPDTWKGGCLLDEEVLKDDISRLRGAMLRTQASSKQSIREWGMSSIVSAS